MPEKGCFGALFGVFQRSIRFLINNLMFYFDLLRSGWIIFKIFLQKCRNEFAYFEILSLSERCSVGFRGGDLAGRKLRKRKTGVCFWYILRNSLRFSSGFRKPQKKCRNICRRRVFRSRNWEKNNNFFNFVNPALQGTRCLESGLKGLFGGLIRLKREILCRCSRFYRC